MTIYSEITAIGASVHKRRLGLETVRFFEKMALRESVHLKAEVQEPSGARGAMVGVHDYVLQAVVPLSAPIAAQPNGDILSECGTHVKSKATAFLLS
ncbi:MAG: hypothetical protein BroJett003_24070 [Planctomycetota bacterium]|nr:MAG: hypothetical protein BroJett003_24070 [Planctomycetota bacterium]